MKALIFLQINPVRDNMQKIQSLVSYSNLKDEPGLWVNTCVAAPPDLCVLKMYQCYDPISVPLS